jgi:hypothetical protein
MKRWMILGTVAVVALAAGLLQSSTVAAGEGPVKTTIWYEDEFVRTILPPSPSPNEGTDPFFMVPGVGGVAEVASGDVGYHGGHWAVFVVSNVDASDIAMYGGLNSADEIHEAAEDGAITLTRRADLDFLCPIQP